MVFAFFLELADLAIQLVDQAVDSGVHVALDLFRVERRAAHNAHWPQMNTPGVFPSSTSRPILTARPQHPQRGTDLSVSRSEAIVVIVHPRRDS